MARKCQITGKGPLTGNSVSHAPQQDQEAATAEPAEETDLRSRTE